MSIYLPVDRGCRTGNAGTHVGKHIGWHGKGYPTDANAVGNTVKTRPGTQFGAIAAALTPLLAKCIVAPFNIGLGQGRPGDATKWYAVWV